MPKPVIGKMSCIACDCCVDACAEIAGQYVLATGDEGKAVVANPERCIGCEECALICPMEAIIVTGCW